MAITKSFTDAVASGNVKSIRIMMKDSLLVDLTFHDFNEMSRLAAKIPGLYDTHDGRMFIEDSSAWNDDYMNKLMVQVVGNFSHERLEHLKEVVRYLRPAPKHDVSEQKPHYQTKHHSSVNRSQPWSPMNYQKQKAEDAHSGRIVKIAGGTAIGAVIGGVGAAIIGSATGTVIACAAAGAAAGGAIVTFATKGGADDE